MSGRGTAKDKGQRWLPFVIVTVVGLAWATALAGPFQFDDHNVIVDYAPVHSLAAWADALPGLRPLLKLTYALNWTWSPAPYGFHLVNVLVHLLNTVLLAAWMSRALPLAPRAAWLLAALWALHPVQTEAVTYIAGRSVSLSTTFLFAGLLWLASAAPRPAAAPAGQAALPPAASFATRAAPWGAALCTVLALGVRETAWVFPLLFALVAWLRGAGPREVLRNAGPSLAVVGLAAVAFLVEPHYQRMIETSFAQRDPGAQLRGQVLAHGWLLGQLVALAPNIDPDLRLPAAWTPRLALQAALLVALALLALWRVLRARSWVAAGLLWYGLCLLPTNSLMPRVDLASERHLYAALAGPLWSLLLLARARHEAAPLLVARLAPWGAAALVMMLAFATLLRNEDYRTELALWARTAQQSPQKARVWNNLGMACREAGERECATAAFARAMALDPADPRPALNLYFLRKEMRGTPMAAPGG